MKMVLYALLGSTDFPNSIALLMTFPNFHLLTVSKCQYNDGIKTNSYTITMFLHVPCNPCLGCLTGVRLIIGTALECMSLLTRGS